MSIIIRRKERLQVGFAALVIISCVLLIVSAIIRVSSIKATCEPSSGMSQNGTEACELDVAEEPQQQIIEESTSVAAEEASSEPELLEESNLETVETSEPVLVAARETEAVEQAESEESLVESEPGTAEDAPYESTAESTFVVVADTKPEPEMIEEPDPEVIEETEARAIEETDIEMWAEMESETTLEACELDVVEEPQQQTIEEPTSVAAEEASSEPELLEEPNLESLERSEPVLVAAREPEVIEQAESEESLVEPEPWPAEDAPYESTMESTFVVDADTKPEPEMIEEPDPEVIEKTEARATEKTDTEVFTEIESKKTLAAFEQEVVEELQQQIIEEPTSVAAEEASFEPELLEQPDLESVERSEPVLVAAREPETIEQTASEESLDESEPWIAEDAQYESAAEPTFVVVADPKPGPEMIEEPDPDVIEKTEARATEGGDAEVFAEREPEETLVAYELEVVEEPRQEIVEKQESVFSSLLRGVFGEHKTADVEGPTTKSIEASEPKVAKKSQPEVSVIEEETDSVSLRLANIIGGKAGPAATEKPQATTAEEVKPDEALEASEPEVVKEPRHEIVQKKKSVFSHLQEILKELKRQH